MPWCSVTRGIEKSSIASLNSRWKLSPHADAGTPRRADRSASITEFARHGDRAARFERLVHPERLAPAVFRRLDAVGEAAHAILEQRAIDEARPDVERVDQFATEPLEAPGLVGVYDQIVVALAQAIVEVDDAADELRRENADSRSEEVDSAAGRRRQAV